MSNVGPDSAAHGAITQQPGLSSSFNESPWTSPGGVTVRSLRDNPEDAEFAGRLMIEAFRPKLAHAIGERNLPSFTTKVIKGFYSGQKTNFYTRIFVAEYEGRRAGLAQLKFHGDRDDAHFENICEMGCCAVCGLICFEMALGQNVSSGKCLLDAIGVEEGFRGKGIGKALLDRAEIEARARQCSVIYLDVMSNNRAKSLYDRQGYVVKSEKSCCGCLRCAAGVKSYYEMEKQL